MWVSHASQSAVVAHLCACAALPKICRPSFSRLTTLNPPHTHFHPLSHLHTVAYWPHLLLLVSSIVVLPLCYPLFVLCCCIVALLRSMQQLVSSPEGLSEPFPGRLRHFFPPSVHCPPTAVNLSLPELPPARSSWRSSSHPPLPLSSSSASLQTPTSASPLVRHDYGVLPRIVPMSVHSESVNETASRAAVPSQSPLDNYESTVKGGLSQTAPYLFYFLASVITIVVAVAIVLGVLGGAGLLSPRRASASHSSGQIITASETYVIVPAASCTSPSSVL